MIPWKPSVLSLATQSKWPAYSPTFHGGINGLYPRTPQTGLLRDIIASTGTKIWLLVAVWTLVWAME